MLFLEYLKHGDMRSLIAKVAREKVKVPNRQLLRVFNCLARACIAMEFPPRRKFGYRGREDWTMNEYESRMDVEEGIPLGANSNRGFGLVHFDLDPTNVLVGDFDNRRHRYGPVFKVGDFGLATRTSSRIFRDPPQAIWQRRFGKLLYHLPEQFHRMPTQVDLILSSNSMADAGNTEEWDYVDVLPEQENPRPRIAGNYGPASNVFAIGMVSFLSNNTGPLR